MPGQAYLPWLGLIRVLEANRGGTESNRLLESRGADEGVAGCYCARFNRLGARCCVKVGGAGFEVGFCGR